MDTRANFSTPVVQKAAGAFEENIPLILNFRPDVTVQSVFLRVLGTALVLSAAIMWVLPGAEGDSQLVLMKLGMSIFLLFCGLAVMMMNHPDARPDAYFDPIRREVRVLQKNNKGRPQTVLRRSYDTIGSVKFRERTVELFDMDGSPLMRLTLASNEVRHALRMQLSGAVPISS
ncbi:MAG: hypothetical protein GJ676_15640 [Rhodobacteraceae bacterium]|nr:hypothetical protein [Paracoccaceae bacterium]